MVQGVGLGTRLGGALDPGPIDAEGGAGKATHWLGAGRWVLRGLGRTGTGREGGG